MRCIICGDNATIQKYGYSFCEEHKKYSKIDPEDLEELVIWRFEGLSISEIEKRLDDML